VLDPEKLIVRYPHRSVAGMLDDDKGVQSRRPQYAYARVIRAREIDTPLVASRDPGSVLNHSQRRHFFRRIAMSDQTRN